MQTHQARSLSNLNSAFEVKAVDKTARSIVPRRGAPIRPFPGVSNADANWMKVKAYEAADLMEYADCWTGEMKMRPIPFVSTDSKPLYAQQLMQKHLGKVFDFLLPTIKPHIQPINKVSALGYPINGNPGDGYDLTGVKRYESKFDVVLDLFSRLEGGDYSMYDDGYHTIGVRKQNEPPSKEREFQFITSDGEIIQRTITAKDREIEVPELGTMIGSRTRTIVRPPVLNLWLQCWDSMLHNAIMEHPLCDSNVYDHDKWPDNTSFITFDCKHYERYLGMAALTYAETVGGIYGAKLDMMIRYPFIVPSMDWKNFFHIRPLFKEGVYPQFSSGLSPVAPLGKLTNICAQVEYFISHKHYDTQSAVAAVFSGESPGLRRWMYGDDNRVIGEPSEMRAFVDFMATVFDIEEDERPKYLGMEYTPETKEFMLPAATYNTKLYQPERDFTFKDYPFLGMVERRAVFSSFGVPEISKTIIPYEDSLWQAIDVPYHTIQARAVAERIKAANKGVTLNRWLVTDKEYLMSDDARIEAGTAWHLKSDVTASIVLAIVGTTIKERLQFRNAPFTPVPRVEKQLKPFVQQQLTNNTIDESSDTNNNND